MPLYLLALLLPEPLHSAVWNLKQEIHRRTGSRNVVRLPPHITLLPPLRQPATFATELLPLLARFARQQAACAFRLENFAWFQDRTLYVRVTEDTGLLQFHAALYAQLRLELPVVPQPERPFVPHVTLATRDLPPALVAGLRQEFARRTYQAAGWLQELAFFHHDGQMWQEVERFILPLPPNAKNPG
ncbi:2'-5' RNA ligase family protein [Hymenobacter perfusus]|uniref:2'-5' RNA ligase family protein n=1 Tax=Hymenobacter perfusus TaxID=1236770 RepID=A0A428K405_9BACT|nr:2'-5' RNA ligase family protein [Hymenobacter perfusus]RSK41150.1 2'-5' RNA ligase family protein [Hymenobacter perfusus]